MKVLVLGSGGREHALALRLAQDPGVDAVVCAPGNPGTARLGINRDVDLTNPHAVADLAAALDVQLTIVGPETPLQAGVADVFASRGLPVVGPTAAAARLETSKAFAKAFMSRHGIPTARYRVFQSADEAAACVAAGELGFPIVVKADGLAAGKGVTIAPDCIVAQAAIAEMMEAHRFGASGDLVVLEECLAGREASFFVLADGHRAAFIGSAEDHKRIFDEDRGPNTGGMGTFAPSPLVDPNLEARVMAEIVEPTLAGMLAEGYAYRGFLYVGLMITADGPKVIEFNARLGDPEAQVLLPLIDEPLVPLLEAAACGTLAARRCRFGDRVRVAVVLASKGYPESSESGVAILGLEEAARIEGVTVYHAGTAYRGGKLVTAGGRVLTVAADGASYTDATARAYAAVDLIRFAGMQFRRDIGRKAVQSPDHQFTTSPDPRT